MPQYVSSKMKPLSSLCPSAVTVESMYLELGNLSVHGGHVIDNKHQSV